MNDFGTTGRFVESDPSNNTLSQTITIGGSAPTASLSASPTTITSGQSSTLTWSSTNATSCSGTGSTASGTSGSTSVSPTATTTYTVTCNGATASATASTTVTVTASAPTASLSASPTTIVSGQSSTLTWSSTNATSCSGTGFTASGTSGSTSVSPTATTTYTVTCNGAAASATVTVTATALPDLIATSFTYNSTTHLFTIVVKNQGAGPTPNGVVIGNGFYVDGNFVTWGAVPGPLVPGASVTIDSSGGGAYTIASGTHTIMVKVDDFGCCGRITESDETNNTLTQSITIGGSAPTASLSASPTTITSGQSSTLTWSSTNATSCSGTGFTASGTSGSTSVSPTATTTYTVTCNGAAASATVTVTATALPDLIATSFTYNSTTHLFTIVVKNQGAGPTPNGVVIGNGFYVDGNFVTWGAVPGPLAPGASVTIDSSGGGAYTIAPGTHTIMVKVDDFGCCGRITESDETNNTLTQSITLP